MWGMIGGMIQIVLREYNQFNSLAEIFGFVLISESVKPKQRTLKKKIRLTQEELFRLQLAEFLLVVSGFLFLAQTIINEFYKIKINFNFF